MFCKISSLAIRFLRGYRSSKDDGICSAIKSIVNSKRVGFFIGLTTDIEPRLPHSEFHRSRDFKHSINYPVILFSTYVGRRFLTKIKLVIVGLIAKKLNLIIGFLSVDGFSHIRIGVIPKKSFLVTIWYNEEEEANKYWRQQSSLAKNIPKVEFFTPREGVTLQSAKNSERLGQVFNFLKPSILDDHFPSIPTILFASDIFIELRPNLLAYQERLQYQFGLKFNFDEVLWSEARFRVTNLVANNGFNLKSLGEIASALEMHGESAFPTPVEFDALCLTLFGRERYLYIKAISESEFSDDLVLIGQTWFQFPSLRKHLSNLKRFPSSSEVQLLQKSRVCPDFGSSLGPIPRYLRSEILASRSIGLTQRRETRGNPFLKGVESARLFGSCEELLQSCRFLMSLSDEEILCQSKQIRDNYLHYFEKSTNEYQTKINYLMNKYSDNV